MTTEIVTMKTKVPSNEFINIVDSLEREFHSQQDGFLDTELLYDEQRDEWIMIQHWDSMEKLKAASKKIFHDQAAAAFVKALEPKSVKMKALPQLGRW